MMIPWHFEINESEVARQMLKRKRNLQEQLKDEQTKRVKHEVEVRKLKRTTRQQSLALVRIKSGH